MFTYTNSLWFDTNSACNECKMSQQCLHRYHPCQTHSACAWIGFTRASEIYRIEAFICWCKRSRLCSEDTATFAKLCDTADERLFARVMGNSAHTLYQLLTPISANHQNYDLRPHRHNRTLLNTLHAWVMPILVTVFYILTHIDFNSVYCILLYLCWLRSVDHK